MAKPKVLQKDQLNLRWAKKDIDWIRDEAAHRRMPATSLVRMIVFEWLRKNAETKEPK